jgi:hypothetical protein
MLKGYGEKALDGSAARADEYRSPATMPERQPGAGSWRLSLSSRTTPTRPGSLTGVLYVIIRFMA